MTMNPAKKAWITRHKNAQLKAAGKPQIPTSKTKKPKTTPAQRARAKEKAAVQSRNLQIKAARKKARAAIEPKTRKVKGQPRREAPPTGLEHLARPSNLGERRPAKAARAAVRANDVVVDFKEARARAASRKAVKSKQKKK